MSGEEYWFWLCTSEGVYPESIKRLLEAYETPENIYALPRGQLAEDGIINNKPAFGLENEKKTENFRRRLEKLKNSDMDFIYFESEAFPGRLKNIPDHPFCLFVRGKLPNPNLPSCAIVGARACSEYGKKAAIDFSSQLAQAGVQIISGMAAGIDSIAQKAAIDAGGTTYAVLGGGADVIYPAQNTELYWRIISEGGGIISEYPPKTAPVSWQFPHRNRIISGLCDKLLIMEARKRSGTLSTARHALEQGRDIYALPGRIDDPLSAGCNELIFDGAGILLSPGHIINGFFTASEAAAAPFFSSVSDEENDETEFMKFLSRHARGVDEIAREAGLSIEETTVKLTVLELEGRVKEVGKDFYVRN